MHLFRVPLLCLVVALGACSSTPTKPPAASKVEATRMAPLSDSEEAGSRAALFALGLSGTPYKWGGNTPQSGFDCSGLIRYVYEHAAGKRLPRTVAQQAKIGTIVSRKQMQPGDLLIFNTTGKHSHAGIYLGDGRFVHAPRTGGTVGIAKLNSSYWSKRLARVVRP